MEVRSLFAEQPPLAVTQALIFPVTIQSRSHLLPHHSSFTSLTSLPWAFLGAAVTVELFLATFIAFMTTLVLCRGAFWPLARSICARALYPPRIRVCTGPGVLLNKSKHGLVVWTSLPSLWEKNWQLLLRSSWRLPLRASTRRGEFHLLQPPGFMTHWPSARSETNNLCFFTPSNN